MCEALPERLKAWMMKNNKGSSSVYNSPSELAMVRPRISS